MCKDFIFFANTEIRHFETFFFHGKHTFSFDLNGNPDAQIDFNFGGLKIFQFCSGIEDELMSVLHTLEMFVGGLSLHPFVPFVGSHTPEYQEKANLKLIKEAMNITIEERSTYEVHISPD